MGVVYGSMPIILGRFWKNIPKGRCLGGIPIRPDWFAGAVWVVLPI